MVVNCVTEHIKETISLNGSHLENSKDGRKMLRMRITALFGGKHIISASIYTT